MKNKYNVIWIDDEWDKMTAFKNECEIIHQIHLEPFRTQKAGMEELDRNLSIWDAVILDAKMFDQSEDEIPMLKGLTNAINHINQLSFKKRIPYFISTGQPDLMDDKTFGQLYKHFYIKEKDDLKLIDDVKREIEQSLRRQVQAYYNEAIEQLNKLSNNASDIVLDIFESMHYPADHSDFKPILYYNPLRQILEYNFRAANKVGIIPDNCFDDNGDPILGECSRYLNGKETKYTKVKVRYGQEGSRVVPPHIELLIRMVLEIGNINSHSAKLSDTELQELEQYFNKNVFNSRYLIYSLALNVCEITLWMNDYINSHHNIEENKKMCRPILDNQTTSKNIDKTDIKEDELIGVVMCDNGIYHIGSRFFVNKNYIERNNLLDKKVRIVEHDINSNSGTKEKYPYFACRVKLVNE